jgi:hypothetical protein
MIVTPIPGIETKRNGLAGMRLVQNSCYLAIGLSVTTVASGSRIDMRGSIVMRSHKSYGSDLMPTISALPGARRADVSSFGVPEPRQWFGVANVRPKRQSQRQNWLSRGCQLNDLDNRRDGPTMLRSPV